MAAIAGEINLYRRPVIISGLIKPTVEEIKLIKIVRQLQANKLEHNEAGILLDRQVEAILKEGQTLTSPINAVSVGDTPGV